MVSSSACTRAAAHRSFARSDPLASKRSTVFFPSYDCPRAKEKQHFDTHTHRQTPKYFNTLSHGVATEARCKMSAVPNKSALRPTFSQAATTCVDQSPTCGGAVVSESKNCKAGLRRKPNHGPTLIMCCGAFSNPAFNASCYWRTSFTPLSHADCKATDNLLPTDNKSTQNSRSRMRGAQVMPETSLKRWVN